MSIEQFLKQPAVNILVSGHYRLPYWYDKQGKLRTFACRTSRVSPYRMIVNVPVVGKVGDHLTCVFEDLGEVNGCVSDTTESSFLLELEMARAMRQKFAHKLVWLEKKSKDPRVVDGRRDARIVPANAHSTLTFSDATVRSCFVIDMSVSGVAVSAEVQPPLGMPLAVGTCVGRVVRVFDDGFAVKFVHPLNRDELEQRIARPVQPRSNNHQYPERNDESHRQVFER